MNKDTLIVRSTTNRGERAKQIFKVVHIKGGEPTLLIRKLVLSKDTNFWGEGVKTFKGYTLFEAWFSLKLDTFLKVTDFVNSFATFLKASDFVNNLDKQEPTFCKKGLDRVCFRCQNVEHKVGRKREDEVDVYWCKFNHFTKTFIRKTI